MGNFKRSLDGTLHTFKYFKYTHRYLADATWRFNRRFENAGVPPAGGVRALQTMAGTDAEGQRNLGSVLNIDAKQVIARVI